MLEQFPDFMGLKAVSVISNVEFEKKVKEENKDALLSVLLRLPLIKSALCIFKSDLYFQFYSFFVKDYRLVNLKAKLLKEVIEY